MRKCPKSIGLWAPTGSTLLLNFMQFRWELFELQRFLRVIFVTDEQIAKGSQIPISLKCCNFHLNTCKQPVCKKLAGFRRALLTQKPIRGVLASSRGGMLERGGARPPLSNAVRRFLVLPVRIHAEFMHFRYEFMQIPVRIHANSLLNVKFYRIEDSLFCFFWTLEAF